MGTTRTFSIHFWLNLSKINGDLAPIYAHITVDGRRAEISLQRQTSVTYWDTKSKKTTSRTPEGKELNAYLDQVYAKLLHCHKELTSDRELVTAKLIKSRFVGQVERHKTILELVAYHNSNMKGVLAKGTLKNYFTTERYLKQFLVEKRKTRDEYLKHLTYSFIIDFEQFLRKAKPSQASNPLNNTGIMKHMERLKKIMNLGLDLEWLDKNPFARYKLKFHNFKKEFLSREELACFEKEPLSHPGMDIVRDIFVFCCYTRLSYIDVQRLTEKNIVRGIDGAHWIYTSRAKNKISVRIPLLIPALRIIEKHEGSPRCNDKQLLPVFSNQKINSYLKDICKFLDIEKQITFHSARHTFATTITLSNGIPIETVSKMLGHTKISTTQVYARVLEEKISSDMHDLQRKLIPGNYMYSNNQPSTQIR